MYFAIIIYILKYNKYYCLYFILLYYIFAKTNAALENKILFFQKHYKSIYLQYICMFVYVYIYINIYKRRDFKL